MHNKAALTVVDYVVFCGTILVSFLIGIFTVRRGKQSADDFHTGGRSLSPIAVGFSLVTSFVSSISILGMSGETYTHGMQLYIFVFGCLLGMYATTFISLPVFAALQLTSTNEYIEMRFHSNRLTTFISFISILRKIIYMGVCLYAPTIALAAVTSLDVYTYIVILGIVCTIYSAVGGIRAVVWTDVFQMSVMSIGITAVVVIGVWKIGLGPIWSIGNDGGRTVLFDMRINPFNRWSFWHCFSFGFFLAINVYGVDQLNMQRISAVPTEKDARTVLLITAIGMIIAYTFIFGSGLIVYAYYAGCDPMSLGYIGKSAEIVPYFVMDNLSFIYGLPGVFIAALFSGTLSSLSSAINGAVAMIWKDFLEKFTFFSTMTPQMAYFVNSAISMLIGLIVIGMAFISSTAQSIITYSYTMASIFNGPVFGVFMLGLLVPRCNSTGAWCGILISWVFMMWMALGSLVHLKPPANLPLSTDVCNMTIEDGSNSTILILDSFNYDELNQSFWSEVTSDQFTGNTDAVTPIPDESYVFPLYRVSYLLYNFIGPLICILVALLVTQFGSSQKASNVSQNLIAPFVRHYYYKQVATVELQENFASQVELQENSASQSRVPNHGEAIGKL